MSGASIAAEVAAALQEVATEVGSGAFQAVLIRGVAEAENPWGAPPAEPERISINAMVQDYPRKMIDGTLIRQEDRKVMLSATGTRPTTADFLEIEGVKYAIIDVRDIAPSGVPLYYQAQVRL